jgi:hypothetical protein
MSHRIYTEDGGNTFLRNISTYLLHISRWHPNLEMRESSTLQHCNKYTLICYELVLVFCFSFFLYIIRGTSPSMLVESSKLLLVLASTVILNSEFHGTHDHILLLTAPGAYRPTLQAYVGLYLKLFRSRFFCVCFNSLFTVIQSFCDIDLWYETLRDLLN